MKGKYHMPMRYPLDNWERLTKGLRFKQPYPQGFGSLTGKHHLGIDVIIPVGTYIYAPSAGRIIDEIPKERAPEGGNTIHFIDYQGRLWRFLHLSKFVAPIGSVKIGQIIGLSGNTGVSTTPHCHIDVSQNATLILSIKHFIDPEKYLEMYVTNNQQGDVMFSFEESIVLAHWLMIGRAPSEQEKFRWFSKPHTRATVDECFSDLSRTETDAHVPTYRKHTMNAHSFYLRGSDLRDDELPVTQVADAYLSKVTTGIVLAVDKTKPEAEQKLLNK